MVCSALCQSALYSARETSLQSYMERESGLLQAKGELAFMDRSLHPWLLISPSSSKWDHQILTAWLVQNVLPWLVRIEPLQLTGAMQLWLDGESLSPIGWNRILGNFYMGWLRWQQHSTGRQFRTEASPGSAACVTGHCWNGCQALLFYLSPQGVILSRCLFLFSGSTLEITQLSFNKINLVHPNNGILLSRKQGTTTDTYNNVDESQHGWKEPDLQDSILYGCIYMTL